VWAECWRVLEPSCRLCVNIGDQFCSSQIYDRFKVMPIHAAIIVACEYIGFDYMGCIIWNKIATMRPAGGGKITGSYPYPRECLAKMNFEYILLFKKPGKAKRKPTEEQKAAARLTKEEWLEYTNYVWNIPGVKQDDYIAVFPAEVPKRLIRMFTFPGERVLDPFLGSGTTILAAEALGRHGIGYEVSPIAHQVLKNRLSYIENIDWIMEPDENRKQAVDDIIAGLPFRYNDLHPLQVKRNHSEIGYKVNAESVTNTERTLFYDE